MFMIDLAQYLATQEVIIQTRTQPLGPLRRRGGRRRRSRRLSLDHAEPDDDRRPATRSTRDSFLSSESENEGQIIGTPVGAVRPWPRGDGRIGEETIGLARGDDADGDDGLLLKGEGNPQMDLVDSLQPRAGQSPVSEGDAHTRGSGFGEAPIIQTPMGTVRPTRLWWRRRREMAGGDDDARNAGVESLGRKDEGVERSLGQAGLLTKDSGEGLADGEESEETIIETPMGIVRPTRTGYGRSGTGKAGDDTTKPAKPSVGNGEKGVGSAEKPPADTSIPGNGTVSSVFQDIVNKFLANSRQLTEHPNATATLDEGRPPTTSSEKPAPRAGLETTTNPNDLHNITTITLLAEDIRALTAFYTNILGATLASTTSTSTSTVSTTLSFTPHLTIILLDSTVARTHAVFGDDVTVGRQAGMPKRMLLGVEVSDVDAVWRRLRDAGHGAEESDGQEALGEVRIVRGTQGGRRWKKRSLCFVDLAGHCWEAWQRLSAEEDGEVKRGLGPS